VGAMGSDVGTEIGENDDVVSRGSSLFNEMDGGGGEMGSVERSDIESQRSIPLTNRSGRNSDRFDESGGGSKMNDEKKPLLSDVGSVDTHGNPKSSSGSKTNKKKKGGDDSEFMLKKIKMFMEMGEIDDDARWMEMTLHNKETHEMIPRGRVAMSIEILPLDQAESSPVGEGRENPNTNPYLPPPMGRLKFSLNPCTMLYQLCGAQGMAKICGCLCCLILLVLLWYKFLYQVETFSI